MSARPTSLVSQPSALGTQPSMRGWLNTYYRYHNGKKLGPYYVRRWKVNGKVRKQYVKPEDVEKVRAACQANRDRRIAMQACGRECRALIDNFKFQWRMICLFDKGKEPRPDQKAYIVRLHEEGMYITGRPLYRRRRRFMVPLASSFLKMLEEVKDILQISGQKAMLGRLRDDIERLKNEEMLDQRSEHPGSASRKTSIYGNPWLFGPSPS